MRLVIQGLPLSCMSTQPEDVCFLIIQAYGLTEASPLTHAVPPDPSVIRLDSVGMPVNNTEHKIVDIETGERELPPGEDGEILVRGPQVMFGREQEVAEISALLRRPEVRLLNKDENSVEHNPWNISRVRR